MKIKRKDKENKKNDINVKIIEKNTNVLHKILHGKGLNKQKTDNLYIIHIVYSDDDDKQMADVLRKTFNKNGHRATYGDYSQYKCTISEMPDYYIFINHPADEFPDNKYEVFKNYGCEIFSSDRYIYIKYDGRYCDSINMVKFVEYYKGLVEETFAAEETYKNICKNYCGIKKRSEKKYDEPKFINKFLDRIKKFMEFAEEQHPLLAIPMMICTIPVILLGGISLLPLDFTEVIVEMTVDELKDKNFNRKYFREAQQHILEIKIIEYIETLRMEKILLTGASSQKKSF